jgi:hypothetical protein
MDKEEVIKRLLELNTTIKESKTARTALIQQITREFCQKCQKTWRECQECKLHNAMNDYFQKS